MSFEYNALVNKTEGLAKFFGRVVAEERTRQGLSQEKLAELIGSTNFYICVLETGKRLPSLNTVVQIARSLKITTAELMRRVEERLDEQEPSEPTQNQS